MSILDVFGLHLGSITSLFWPQNSRLVVFVVVFWSFLPVWPKGIVPTQGPTDFFTLSRGTLRLESGVTVIGAGVGVTPRRRLFLLILLIVDCSYEIPLLRSLNFEVLQAYVISLQLDSFSGSLARNCVAASKHSERPARSLLRHGSISGRLCYHGWVEA